MHNLWVQVLGLGGTGLTAISYQCHKKRTLLLIQLISAGMFIVHYMALNAETGAYMNMIVAARCVVFRYKSSKTNSITWIVVFSVLSTLGGLVSWNGWISLMAIGGSVLHIIGTWLDDPRHLRQVSACGSGLWLIYNVCCNSFAGCVSSTINMVSIFVYLLRLNRNNEE